jgi:hypothetical protein
MWELLALWILQRAAEARSAGPAPVANPVGEQLFYRTRDGRTDYAFSIERHSNRSYRVYITGQPPYGSRSTEPGATHRLTDDAGRRFICWSKPIESHQQARQVAAIWAEATERYICTGRRF